MKKVAGDCSRCRSRSKRWLHPQAAAGVPGAAGAAPELRCPRGQGCVPSCTGILLRDGSMGCSDPQRC